MKTKTLFFSSLIAAAAMGTVPAFADTTGSTNSIWINFASAKGTDAAGYDGTWNNTYNGFGTVDSLNYSGSTASGASLTYSSKETWGYSVGITDGVLKGYLDDTDGVTISVSNISYLVYDVTILAATDTEGATFSAKTVNGLSYTSDGSGNGIFGDGSWGASRQASINDKNSFSVSGLTGNLSLSSAKISTSIRGGIAGLIITNSGGTAVNATISDDSATWTSNSLAGTAWTNAATDSRYLANITLDSSVALNVTGTDITTTAIIASGDSKTLTLSGEAVSLIGPGVIRTDSTSANIVINNTLNFASGGRISGNVSTSEGGLLNVSGGAFSVSASEDSSLNVSIGEGVSLALSSGTVNITAGTKTISTLLQTGGTLNISESATATITTANLTGGALSGGNITTANVTSGTVAISGSTIGTLYSQTSTINIGDGTNESVVSATRVEIGDNNGGTSALNVKKNATLAITGSDNGTNYKSASLLFSEWNNTTTANIKGSLLAKDAKLLRGDYATTLDVSGGTLAVKGFYATKNSGNAVTVNVSESGKLILGSGDVSGINSVNVYLNNGTFAASESSITFSKNIALTGAGTIDTTKYDFADDGKSIARGTDAAKITLSGGLTFSGDDSALEISGNGSVTLGGTVSGATVDSTAKITVNSDSTLKLDASNLVYALTGTDDSINGKTLNIATGAGTISGTLTRDNFTWNGSALSGRTEVSALTNGSVKFTGAAANLVWNGGESCTWNTTTENWTNGSDPDKFYSKDNVTFSAGQDVSVTFSENLTAGKVSIAGNVTLASSITGTLTGEIIVADGGTLTVSKGSSSGVSAIRGSLTIQSGGKASFTAGDVCGWSDTASSRLNAITVDSGGTLEINHGGNETFRGTLTLNGTLTSGTSGGSGTAWDLFGGSAKIVTTAAGAKIDSGVNLRFRQNNSEINVGSDASLEIASVINDTVSSWNEGNGLLRKTGAGTLTLSGVNTYSGGTNIEKGTLVANNAKALGTGPVSVASDAELGLVAGTTVEVSGGITLTEGAKIVIDMTGVSATETFTLNLITGTELTYGGTSITSDNVNSTLENVIEFSNWSDESLNDWTQKLTFDDSSKKLSLSLTKIPEPSAFGLLAGVGALVFVAARRRRRAK